MSLMRYDEPQFMWVSRVLMNAARIDVTMMPLRPGGMRSSIMVG